MSAETETQTIPAARDRRIALGTMMGGFASALAGVAMWSIPAALVIGGVVLFVAGGLSIRQLGESPTRPAQPWKREPNKGRAS